MFDNADAAAPTEVREEKKETGVIDSILFPE